MFCQKCGYKNSDTNRHCSNCGADLPPKGTDLVLNAQIDRLMDQLQPVIATDKDRKIKWFFFAMAILILLLSFIWSKFFIVAVIGIILIASAGISAGFPELIWKMERYKFRYYNTSGTIVPNEKWQVSRKISYWICFFLGLFLSLITFDASLLGAFMIFIGGLR